MKHGDLQPPKSLDIRRELRGSMTKPEIILWQHLKNKGIGYKFIRQYGIGSFVVDFYCPSKKLVIELDGSQHSEEQDKVYDQERTKFINSKNIKVLRFWNNEVFSNINGVLEKILLELKKN